MIDVPVTAALTDCAPVIQSDCSIVAAATQLRRPDVPALVVVDAMGEVAGVLTESDIVAAVAEDGVTNPVERCMSTPVVTVAPTTSVGLAADRMRDAGVATLPVVDADDGYQGLVTRDTLAPYLSRKRLEITWDDEPLRIE
ncbi:CBS domain-containing protein [Halovenus marina]|uniref:CBS domain-containing protein n=1 Tax=Halovenus marina TaxID=3396621 RepID=UPI003F5741AD